MRILIATTQVPFISGGAEALVRSFLDALTLCGHDADVFRLPYDGRSSAHVFDTMLAAQLIDLSSAFGDSIDHVVGMRFPAWYCAHPRMRMWIIHQDRSLFDLWDAPEAGRPGQAQAGALREAAMTADRNAFAAAERLFTISDVVTKRVRDSTGLTARTLVPPPENAGRFHCAAAEPFIYFPSRLSGLKRQDLALGALAAAPPHVRLVLAGAPDNPAIEARLRALAQKLDIDARVTFAGHVDLDAHVDLMARCAAVLFPPFDEDLGYVTLEAMLAAKPVITCVDSGGPLSFVVDGETGWIVAPEATEIASAMAGAIDAPDGAAARGRAGAARYDALGLSWPNIVEAIVG